MPTAKQQTSRAYIGLGSNLEDREANMRSAITALRRIGSVEKISSFYETEPVGTISQPDFLNAVVTLQTELSPEYLLAALLRIERDHGRDRSATPPKGPRTLDLDLLAYDDLVLETPSLTLPHPSLAGRRFVLVPLAEIAPEWRHPVNRKTASQLLAELSEEVAQPGGDTAQTVRKISSRPQSS
ncbi:MAG: 2-amino-4-hydroxy-6-hydroxymethyldihydropteridine diphosphokinase [Acidobacteriaceae bacterium]